MDSELLNFGLRAVVTLLAVIDPIGNVPFYVTATEGMVAAQRRRVAWQATLAAAGVLAAFTVGGTAVLRMFNVTIPAVRIGGGIILLVVALRMLEGWQFHWGQEHPAVDEQTRQRTSGVSPLGIPLMAGPAAMSSVIVLTSTNPTFAYLLVVAAAVLIACGLSLLCYLAAGPLIRRLGRDAIVTLSALMALILAAMAVQFVLDGLRQAAPGLFAPG